MCIVIGYAEKQKEVKIAIKITIKNSKTNKNEVRKAMKI